MIRSQQGTSDREQDPSNLRDVAGEQDGSSSPIGVGQPLHPPVSPTSTGSGNSFSRTRSSESLFYGTPAADSYRRASMHSSSGVSRYTSQDVRSELGFNGHDNREANQDNRAVTGNTRIAAQKDSTATGLSAEEWSIMKKSYEYRKAETIEARIEKLEEENSRDSDDIGSEAAQIRSLQVELETAKRNIESFKEEFRKVYERMESLELALEGFSEGKTGSAVQANDLTQMPLTKYFVTTSKVDTGIQATTTEASDTSKPSPVISKGLTRKEFEDKKAALFANPTRVAELEWDGGKKPQNTFEGAQDALAGIGSGGPTETGEVVSVDTKIKLEVQDGLANSKWVPHGEYSLQSAKANIKESKAGQSAPASKAITIQPPAPEAHQTTSPGQEVSGSRNPS